MTETFFSSSSWNKLLPVWNLYLGPPELQLIIVFIINITIDEAHTNCSLKQKILSYSQRKSSCLTCLSDFRLRTPSEFRTRTQFILVHVLIELINFHVNKLEEESETTRSQSPLLRWDFQNKTSSTRRAAALSLAVCCPLVAEISHSSWTWNSLISQV